MEDELVNFPYLHAFSHGRRWSKHVTNDVTRNRENGGPHAQSTNTMQSNAVAILPITKNANNCSIQSFASPPTSTILVVMGLFIFARITLC
jgi:hypothetical protein